MDEILALQAALATAQDTKSSIRLSERNIVELVNKLKSLDLLDDTLLYTLNGKEYLTEARLDAEIKREVKRSGGRVPVTDLQPALNVDVAHCERRARALAADASNGVALVEGELITPAYFDAVAAETDEELREAGVIGVGELARRHGLSADLMTKALRERVEAGAVDGRLEGGSVYTPGYVRRLRAQLRGAMRAALVPTTRDALVANALRREDRHGVADAALTGALLGDLARGSSGGSAGSAGKRGSSLRERGGRNEPADAENVAADGALRGGAWHPAVYSRAQAAAVGEVYARAGVVTAEQAKRMGVADPSSYFEAMDIKNRAVALGESFVAPRVVEQLDAAVRDALAENGGWCECGALVPPDLPPADAPALLAATDAVGGAGEKGAGERGGRRRVKTDAQSAAKKSAKKTRNTDDAASPETPFDEAPKKKGDEPDGRVVARLITHSTSRHAHHGALVACATPAFLERARALARELGAARGREEGTRRQLATAPGELAGAGAARRTEISSAEKPRTKTPSPEISPARIPGEDPEASAFVVRADDLDSDDDSSRGRKGKKGKGKGKKGGGGVPSATAPRDSKKKPTKNETLSSASVAGTDPDPNAGAPTVTEVARACVGAAAPGASEAFLDAVAGGESSGVHAAALRAFREAVERTVAEGFAAARLERRDAINAAAVFFEASFPSARAFARGAALLADDAAAQTHCCTTRVVPCVDAFLVSRADPEDEALEGVSKRCFTQNAVTVFGKTENEPTAERLEASSSSTSTRTNAAAPFALARRAREGLALRFPAEARAAANALAAAASAARDPVSVVAALEALFEATSGGKKPRGADRKTERLVARAHRATLEKTLERAVAANDATRAFAAAAPLALVVATGRAVSLTGRSFGSAIGAFRFPDGRAHGALRDEDVAFLDAFHEDLVAALARVPKETRGEKETKKKGDDDGEKDVETGLAALAARLPELARVVATCGKARGGEGVEGGGDDDA
jgi:DNA-binding transcriptional ArsR family regulator